MLRSSLWLAAVMAVLAGVVSAARMRAAAADGAPPAAKPGDAEEGSSSGLVRLAKDYDLWIDQKRKLVVVDGAVCLREGQLEAFACPRGTKEHEAILAVNCKPQFVHAALLAVGAKPGSPMRWDPYKPATGTPVEIMVLWVDAEGKKQKARAQDWIKEVKTGQAMTHSWVFAGSRVWKDEETKQTYYSADGGDFICVSNFPSAMLDLPIKSSQSNTELMFAAFTERIPPLKTKVRLVLMPQLDKDTGEGQKPSGKAGPAPDVSAEP
jgi:hypothetical protein